MKSRNSSPPRPVAVVTGAGIRLGKAITLALHREGYAVVVHFNRSRKGALDVVKSIRADGGAAVQVRSDIRTVAGARTIISGAVRAFGRIDLLVNNAAVFRESSVFSTTEKSWDDAFDTNLKGMFFCSQAAARSMKGKGGGSIINIASVGGLQAWSGYLPYSVSKAGVVMLTKCLAKGLAPAIRVNAIAPGTILIRGEETGLRHIPKRRIPLRKYGSPKDITELVVFLARHAGYVTGQVFTADGGRSII
ncbi:MAG TPA: SDR family oxidoreductase [Bacteroidota bacterium]|nr:SDR family oxidoreductase [Bacteroidota bacterium]